jgi:hypothetical protein
MEPGITAEKLRDTARFVEEEILATLDDLSDVSYPLVVGGAKQFPRPAPEDRAAERGVELLRKDAEDAVAALHALAVALDPELELRGVPALLAALQPSVQPFIDAFQASEGQSSTSEDGPDQTEGNTTT